MISSVRVFGTAFCAVLLSAPLRADFLTFGFTGTVTSISNAFGYLPPSIQVGHPITGNVTYDPNSIPSPINFVPGFQSLYVYTSPPGGMSITVGGFTFANAFDWLGAYQVLVRNSAAEDRLEMDGIASANTWPPEIPPSPDGSNLPRLALILTGSTSPLSLLDSTDLPRSIDLQQASLATGFIVSFSEEHPVTFYAIDFSIDTLTAIPEPGTLALIATFGVGMASWRRRGFFR